MRSRQGLSLLMALLLGCNHPKAKHPQTLNDTIRYRLPLRDNPISSRDASRCFAECQPAPSPKQYIECLELCPGFEKTPGEVCSDTDRPPESACFTVRKVRIKNEPPPGLIVLAIIGEVALVVGAVSLCNVSSSQCGYPLPPMPPPK